MLEIRNNVLASVIEGESTSIAINHGFFSFIWFYFLFTWFTKEFFGNILPKFSLMHVSLFLLCLQTVSWRAGGWWNPPTNPFHSASELLPEPCLHGDEQRPRLYGARAWPWLLLVHLIISASLCQDGHHHHNWPLQQRAEKWGGAEKGSTPKATPLWQEDVASGERDIPVSRGRSRAHLSHFTPRCTTANYRVQASVHFRLTGETQQCVWI